MKRIPWSVPALQGQNDAANLLKPALSARGELRTIFNAATTWAEYSKYFEQDAALARRFQSGSESRRTPSGTGYSYVAWFSPGI